MPNFLCFFLFLIFINPLYANNIKKEKDNNPLKILFIKVQSSESSFKNQSLIIEQIILEELYKYKDFNVIGKSELEKIDPNLSRDMEECFDSGCIIELGGSLGADLLLNCAFGKIKENFLLSLNMFEIQKEKSISRATGFVNFDEKTLNKDVAKVVKKLIHNFDPKFMKERGIKRKNFWSLTNILILSGSIITGGILTYGLIMPDSPNKPSFPFTENQLKSYNSKTDQYKEDISNKHLAQVLGGVGLGLSLGTLVLVNY